MKRAAGILLIAFLFVSRVAIAQGVLGLDALSPATMGELTDDEKDTVARLPDRFANDPIKAEVMTGVLLVSRLGKANATQDGLRILRSAAAKGSVEAQSELAYFYYDGEDFFVPTDYAEALRFAREAASKGDAAAETLLGFLYDEGLGVPEDDAEARRWYLLAAEKNYGFAQFLLGESFDDSLEDVAQNRRKAARWYVKAALSADRAGYVVLARVRLAALHDKDGPAVLSETDAADLTRLREKYPDLFVKQTTSSPRDLSPSDLPRAIPSSRDTATRMTELVDQIERELKPGRILFNPALSVKKGVKESVAIRIAGPEFSGELSKNLNSTNPVKEEDVQVGRFMTVTLSGPSFEIATDSPGLRQNGAQIVPRDQFSEWVFYVNPQESGKHRLTLSAAIRYKLPDREEIRNLPVIEKDIQVEVNHMDDFKKFITAEYRGIAGGLLSVLAATLAFLFRAWFERQGFFKKRSKRSPRSKGVRLPKTE